MDREAVARDQRARLYGGMIESVAQRGYARTTVAHVIALAGVSRRAFYEQFNNKEHCFLATYDIVVARSRKQVLDAWGAERGWANRLHASAKAFLEDIAKQPNGAHLVLVDSLGIGVKARERLHLAGNAYERLIADAFRACPDSTPLPAVASRAIVGGVRHVVFDRIREQRVRELRHLTDELLDWVESYRSPATARLKAMMNKRPPEIPPLPAAFLASDDRRARVLGSVVHLTLDEGYSELTDPQIAQFAGISTEAFHRQFASKEECFLTALDEFAAEALHVVEAAIDPISSWTESVPVAISTFIDHIVSHPALLRMAFVDLFEVGPGMISRLTKPVEVLTAMLSARGPEPRRAPEIAREAITGAIWDIVSAYSSSERRRYLPCLSDQIAFVALAPYTGPKEAIDTIAVVRSRPRLSLRAQAAAARLAARPMIQPDAEPEPKSRRTAKPAAKRTTRRGGTSAKAGTKPAAKAATKAVAKTSAKTAAKTAGAKTTAKAATRTAAKTTAKTAAGTSAKTAAPKTVAGTSAKTAANPAAKSPARRSRTGTHATGSAAKASAAQASTTRPAHKAATKPAAKPASRAAAPTAKSAAKPIAKAATKSAAKPETKTPAQAAKTSRPAAKSTSRAPAKSAGKATKRSSGGSRSSI